MSALLLRQPADALPDAPRSALSGSGAAAFIPIRRVTLLPTPMAMAFFGVPATLGLVVCRWVALVLQPTTIVMVGVGLVALLCVVVLLALGARFVVEARHVRRRQRRMSGQEGVYQAQEWLMLVRGRDDVSLLARSSIAQVVAVRVRYRQGRDAFCNTYPCAVLHDGRQVLMRTPALAIDKTMDELIGAWGVPMALRRIDVTERQLEQFAHF